MKLRLKVLLLTGIPVVCIPSFLYLLSQTSSAFQGHISLSSFFGLFAVAGFILVVIVLIVLEYFVLKRLNLITASIARITHNKDLTLRIPDKGTDEVAELKKNFNHMMLALENSQLTIKHQASHDSLTGLPNRISLFEKLNEALAQAQHNHTKVAVLFLDLDNFKSVNDTLGHHMGNQLLIQLAQRLNKCVFNGDSICRLGGDEFCCIISFSGELTPVDLFVKEIENSISEPFQLEENFVSVSASIGLSLYPDDGHDPQTLLHKADMAMFQIKEAGKNSNQYYTEDMERVFSRRTVLEQSLKKAIKKQEFYLQYQPKIDLRSNKIVGVEALLRWESPLHGQVSPLEFIPIAESIGLGYHIGEWVIREVCRQHNIWKNKGYPEMRISVNLSRVQLEQIDLLRHITTILTEENMEPHYLELEIKENAAMKNIDSLSLIFGALRTMGIILSIDDYGTGYSSLSYLKRFPFHSLKIDPSFINEIGVGLEDEIIVKTIIELGHNLNLTVIAKGVETEKQLNFLQHLNCDEVQGFLIGKPLSPNEVEELLLG